MAYILHAVQSTLHKPVKQLLANHCDDSTNTHKRVDFLSVLITSEDLDAEVLIDELCRESAT